MTEIGSDLLLLREARHLFAVCPCCGEIHRLTDLQIRRVSRYAPDWLDRLQRQRAAIAEKQAALDEKARELRATAKELAERTLLPKKLEQVVPWVARHKIDPRDVRVLIDPTEFVEFRGMNSPDGVSSVQFRFLPASAQRARAIEPLIRSRAFRWNTLRVNDDGVVQPEAGIALESFAKGLSDASQTEGLD